MFILPFWFVIFVTWTCSTNSQMTILGTVIEKEREKGTPESISLQDWNPYADRTAGMENLLYRRKIINCVQFAKVLEKNLQIFKILLYSNLKIRKCNIHEQCFANTK